MEKGLAGERETTMRPCDEDHGDHVQEGETTGERKKERKREKETRRRMKMANIHNMGGIS